MAAFLMDGISGLDLPDAAKLYHRIGWVYSCIWKKTDTSGKTDTEKQDRTGKRQICLIRPVLA